MLFDRSRAPQLQRKMIDIADQDTPPVSAFGPLAKFDWGCRLTALLVHCKAPRKENAVFLDCRLFAQRPNVCAAIPG